MAWLNRIAIDLNNIRATSSWLTRQGRIAEAIEIYANIEWFLFIRGHAVESRRQFETWLTRPELEGDDRSRALALFFAGARAADLGNRSASISMMEEAMAIFRQNGDRFHENYALNIISWTLFFDDQFDRAADGLNQSVDIGREMAHVRWTSLALELLAQIASVKGETELAQSLANESMEIALDGGDLWCIQLITGNLGYQSLLDGELERAERLTNEAERIAEELGDIRNQPAHHMQLAEIARERGEQKFASDHLQITLELGRQAGNKLLTAVALLELGKLACEQGDHDEALKLEKESLDLFQQLGGPSNIVYCLEGFALIAEAVGDRPAATQFLGVADELVTDLGIRMTPPLRVDAIQLANVPRGTPKPVASQTGTNSRAESSMHKHVADALAYELPTAVSTEATTRSPVENPLGLTDRELEVLRIMADGMSNQQIADSLYITRHTAINHVNNILGKLDVNSRTAAVAIAIRSGIA